MGRLGDLAQAQQPVLRDLGAASGELDTFLTRLRPFARGRHARLRGARRRLGRRPPRRARERRGDPGAAPAGEGRARRSPSRCASSSQTIDDRAAAAVEPDARAAATDPPAPDKTHITGRGGFTGMEAIWNYFYWQALSTNALDDIGHVLRLGIVVAPAASRYLTQPEGDDLEDCNQFLGPTQPGVTTPDPTAGAAAAAAAATPDAAGSAAAPPAAVAPSTTGAHRLPAGAMREARRQLAASPVLIGAVTVLVAIVAVFISYNANQGLPFVPTYKLNAELPNGAKLVPGNEVRAGGFRVGVVDDDHRARRTVDGEERSIARLELKLDKQIEPLSVDTRVGRAAALGARAQVRGADPGSRAAHVRDGRHGAAAQRARRGRAGARGRAVDLPARARAPTPRRRSRASATPSPAAAPQINDRDPRAAPVPGPPGAGDAQPLATRAASCATWSRRWPPPPPRSAPVAEVQARLFGDLADTFAALNRDPGALQETIAETPPTLEAATGSFRVQTPFLARFADVSRRLEPGGSRAAPRAAADQRRARRRRARLPAHARAGRRASRSCSRRSRTRPRTPTRCSSLRDLRRAVQVTRPAIEYIAPYQTVCNYLVYFFNPLGTHQSATGAGRHQRAHPGQARRPARSPTRSATTRVDPPGRRADQPDPQTPTVPATPQALHTQYGGPAIDSQGQRRLPERPDRLPQPARDATRATRPTGPGPASSGGGSHVVLDGDTPGLAGGTYKSRQLGIDSLEDVP